MSFLAEHTAKNDYEERLRRTLQMAGLDMTFENHSNELK